MDAFIILVILVFLMVWYRKFSKVVYGVAMIDIFLRLVDIITRNAYIKELSEFSNKYLPSSLPAVIDKYLEGIPEFLVIWGYIVFMGAFLFYTIRIFIKKK